MTLAIEWITLPETVTVGAEIPAKLAIRNRLGVEVGLPSRDGPMPFSFSVLDHEGTEITQFSADDRALTILGNVPSSSLEPEVVRDQGGITYRDDLSSLMVEALAPGTYNLVASYWLEGTRFSSPPRALTIIAPDIKGMGTGLSQDGRAVTSISIGDDSLSRSTAPSGRPDLLSFVALAAAPDLAPSAVIVATEVERSPYIRWALICEGSTLRGAMVADEDATLTTSVSSGLSDPIVLGGWQFSDGSAVFALYEREQSAAIVFATTRPGEPIAMTRAEGTATATFSAMTYNRQAEQPTLTLAQSLADGTVLRRDWRISDLSTPHAAGTLSAAGQPLLALGAPRHAPAAPAYIDTVIAPVNEDTDHPYLSRLTLDGDQVSRIKMPRTRALIERYLWPEDATAFPTIAGFAKGRMAVLSGDQETAEWETVLKDTTGMRDIRIHSISETLWLTWHSAKFGAVWRPL